MATLNLYVPDDLKSRMDERDDLNWSAIAQAAFRAALSHRSSTVMKQSRPSNRYDAANPGPAALGPDSMKHFAESMRRYQEEDAKANPRMGLYALQAKPKRLASRNQGAWRIIEAVLESSGSAVEFDTLADAIRACERDIGNPGAFVLYCVRNQWLERVGTSDPSERRHFKSAR